MCTCGHGADRHYIDYAGPGVCGGILTRCLEGKCPCVLYTVDTSPPMLPSGVIVSYPNLLQGGEIVGNGT